ncbi:hypothetical protein NQZ68_014254, partial [Dissostichus eleginoides]
AKGMHSVRIDSSSVQFKGEVWELSLQQRAHNWHPSCLIKGESTGMDPLSQILAFIRIVCKQTHTRRQLKALLITSCADDEVQDPPPPLSSLATSSPTAAAAPHLLTLTAVLAAFYPFMSPI